MKEVSDLKSKLVIVVGFLTLSYLFDIDLFMHLALGLGFVFLISDKASSWILWLWAKIGHILGWVNTRIILGLAYYFVVLPFAMLFKLFNRDPLSIQWNKKTTSFTTRNHVYVAADLENPW